MAGVVSEFVLGEGLSVIDHTPSTGALRQLRVCQR